MLNRIIIADTSGLIALYNIGELEILQKVYNEVIITPEVESEFHGIVPPWMKIEEVVDKRKIDILKLDLDLGESSAIALALENENSLLIIDEKKGRKIAKSLGVAVTGTLGIIIKAKQLGVIKSVKTIIEKLEADNFWIAPNLKFEVLRRAGELY